MGNHQKNIYTYSYRALFFLTVLFAVFFEIHTPLRAESDKIPIYFYSCEADINNFKLLKIEFDNYLSEFGNYEFLSFSDIDAFENHISKKKKYVLIVSGWHYLRIYDKYSLTPLLMGVRNGKTHQQRILVADKSSDSDSVKTGQVASATTVQHTLTELESIFKDRVDPSKILTVPRDMDALMSVGIGISRSALATENSFDKLSIIHPSLFKRLTIMGTGKPSWLLIVATRDDFVKDKDTEQIFDIFENMQKNLTGRKQMNMLGLDGWEKIEGIDRLKIEGL